MGADGVCPVTGPLPDNASQNGKPLDEDFQGIGPEATVLYDSLHNAVQHIWKSGSSVLDSDPGAAVS